MTDRDDIRATVQARTRDLLLALWRAAPDGVRGEVEAIGKAHKSGELAPMGVTDRLGPLLREREPSDLRRRLAACLVEAGLQGLEQVEVFR